jgi:hypothetical protein
VKIYSYSSELLTFVDAKWTRARLAAFGVLIGTILFYGFIKLNQSVGFTSGARTAKMLAVENNVLRQELISIPPRLKKLEGQTKELCAQDDNFHVLLKHQEIIGDSVTGFTDPGEWLKLQSSNDAAINTHP